MSLETKIAINFVLSIVNLMLAVVDESKVLTIINASVGGFALAIMFAQIADYDDR